MDNITLVDNFPAGPAANEECVYIYAVLNPRWNKRLAELDTGGSDCFAPFLEYLRKEGFAWCDSIVINKGLKSDRYYIGARYADWASVVAEGFS